MRLSIDNWRWAGVPFYLRTGKRLPKRTTEVTIVFRHAPVMFFHGMGIDDLAPNTLEHFDPAGRGHHLQVPRRRCRGQKSMFSR